MDTPEKKSEFAKRVLFGTSKAAAADKQAAGSTRSGSQSSTSSAPGPGVLSTPGTPAKAGLGNGETPSAAAAILFMGIVVCYLAWMKDGGSRTSRGD